MSNYRRLISYIYAYEGGVKGKNIGYAKIEVRGEQCRIHVNVKKIYVGRSDIGVFLLSPGEEILLGRIFIRNGMGEFRMHVKAADIEGSGYGIEQCYGLTVHDVESAWQCYTTIWEDAVTQAAETTLEDVTSENIRKKEEKPEELPVASEPTASEGSRLPVSEEIERELELEEQKLADTVPWPEEESKGARESDTSEEKVVETEPVTDAKDWNQAEEDTRGRRKGMPVSNSDGAENTFMNLGDQAKLEELDRLEKEELSRNNLWNQLQRKYAKVLAFDYDNGCEILSIKPQDIGLLPREVWGYGNNSFLLHGYYNYRHLILAQLNNPQGSPRYLLGVPGHYFSNEKYMASMFGFPHFVLARKQPEEDGRFGYWYTDIRL